MLNSNLHGYNDINIPVVKGTITITGVEADERARQAGEEINK